jgi:AcrR family transcriptional regulator
MPARDTRLRIVETARRLFNKQGTKPISTNHIAKELSISPGNLYYYFRNKEEIIREIFDQLDSEWAHHWVRDHPPLLEDLVDLTNKALFVMWDYRFMNRELGALLQRDPVLRRRYRASRKKRMAESEVFLQGLVASGVIRKPEDPDTLPALLTIMWLIPENWLAYMDIWGKTINKKTVQESIDLFFRVMRPYLSEEALSDLDRLRVDRFPSRQGKKQIP